MEFIQNIIEGSQFPLLTAFLLGLAVAFHPCPLATNIAAMGYIARDVRDKKRVFLNGMLYTAGRVLTYALLGIVLVLALRSGAEFISGDSGLHYIGNWFGEWGETILAPVLIIIGLYFMLTKLFHRHDHCPNIAKRRFSGAWGSVTLGILLAMTFCPESTIVYFGMLLPMSVHADFGLLMPVVFALATAIPTVLMAWGVAYGVAGSPAMQRRIHVIESWMNVVVGLIFILAGVFCLLH